MSAVVDAGECIDMLGPSFRQVAEQPTTLQGVVACAEGSGRAPWEETTNGSPQASVPLRSDHGDMQERRHDCNEVGLGNKYIVMK